ncbi:HutD family protein [Treponema pedis]|uniref:HutD-family protein n=1 Tax=Treponema pedis str. T A4 TaxID=1291379 RepID=S6A321_9SPIR|nr:HutD family protein [Treponema pedis]AGT43161.1 hypothetical protein TPE_0665 [Treponema pedis str. T A4]
MKITKLTEQDFTTSTWQGGTTTQLFIYPPGANYSKRDFLFRLSSATVDTEKSEFTILPGIQRFIAPLTGNLKISHDEKYFTKLKPYEIYGFDGGAKTISMGKVRDFNVMVQENAEASVKNFFLNSHSSLKFGIFKNEIGWLFSYNNSCNLNMDTKNNTSINLNSDKMTLIIFEYEDISASEEKEEIFISTDGNANLFYGKILKIQ